MKMLSLEQHRKRIANMRCAEEQVQTYHRKMRFHNYIPGHVVYHMGDYPAKVDMEPTEYDFNTLKQLSDDGYEWLQWHSDAIDWLRLQGGDTFMNGDWKGTQKFIDLAHHFGHKLVPYISPTYFPTHDPDFQESFTHMKCAFKTHIHYMCSSDLGSAEWREYNFRKTFEVMDRFNFDGIYADFGYDKFLGRWDTSGPVDWGDLRKLYSPLAYDPVAEDYLGMIYSEIKSRGLLYKLHLGAFQAIPAKDKVYDYLWVGEAGKNVKDILSCKNYAPYLVPAFDRNTAPIPDPEIAYVLTIPFGQFPILYYGRPMGMKDKLNVEGLVLYGEKPRADAVRDYYLAHPNGPHTYSEWSSIPDDPTEYARSASYLKLYKPMVTDGSVLQMEIRASSLIASPIPEEVYISMFTNEEQYLVVGNVSGKSYTLTLTNSWKDRQTGKTGREFTVDNNRLLFLIKE